MACHFLLKLQVSEVFSIGGFFNQYRDPILFSWADLLLLCPHILSVYISNVFLITGLWAWSEFVEPDYSGRVRLPQDDHGRYQPSLGGPRH